MMWLHRTIKVYVIEHNKISGVNWHMVVEGDDLPPETFATLSSESSRDSTDLRLASDDVDVGSHP